MKNKKGILMRSALREIRSSLGRYIAILAITALGVGFFAGLIVTKSAMIKTGEEYLRAHRLFDFRILSTLGADTEDVAALRALSGIESAEGSYSADFIHRGEDGAESVLRAHLLTQNVNLLSLTAGRLPETGDECVVDANRFSEDIIGKTISVSENTPTDVIAAFRYREYTVTGLADSPYYLNFERGNSALAGGSVSGFVYIPEDGFSFDYYTEIFIKLSEDAPLFSDEYDALTKGYADRIETTAAASIRARYDDLQKELSDAKNALDDARAALEKERAAGAERLAEEEEKLREAEATLLETMKALRETEAQLDQRSDELEAAYLYGLLTPMEYAAGKAQLTAARTELETGKVQYKAAEEALEKGRGELADARTEFDSAIAEAEAELAEKTAEYESSKADFEALSEPEIFLLGRDSNTGYVCFESDSSIVEGIARVFPIFFFAVAALVCVTTMNRMIDEQRTQIGVLKALGYGTGAVTGKYLFYSGSAGAFGAIAGFLLGSWLFPAAIWKTYDIMYGFADIQFLLDPVLAAVSIAVALVCTAGTTWLSCKKELSETPAQLIRPRAPKSGKRIFLEHIGFIWRRMKFLHKVSARNLFRYKKRLIMMVLGIGGCTALVLTGLGLHDSIANVANSQFDEIQIFDLSVTFSKAQTAKDEKALAEREDFSGAALLSQSSAELRFSDIAKTVYMVVPKEPEMFSDFVRLARRDEAIPFPGDGEIVLTKALSERLGISPGDTVTVTKDEIKTATLVVSGIADNYIYDYIYLSPQTYEAAFSEAPEYKTAYLTVKEGTDIHEASAALLSEEGVAGVSVNADLRERVDHMMGSLNYVILLVIACAAALAFIVLYNLTNINITERVREIATVKVLGFTRGETAAYVFRENVVLTLLGALLGLPMGFALHRFVMANIVIDAVSFHVTITPLSYVLGIALTFVFALLVDLFMRARLDKINMAESLKSVE